MKTTRLLALISSLTIASSITAAPVTLFSNNFDDLTLGSFFGSGWSGPAGTLLVTDALDANLLFDVTHPLTGGFYAGYGAALGNLGTFASLANLSISFDVVASHVLPGHISIAIKNDAINRSSSKLLSISTTSQTVTIPFNELVGNLTLEDLTSPQLQLIITTVNDNTWPTDPINPGRTTVNFDNFLISGTPGDPVVRYTREQLVELALGQPVLEKVGGNFILKLRLKESANLTTPFTDKVLLPTDVSVVNGELHINVVPQAGTTEFYRLSTQP